MVPQRRADAMVYWHFERESPRGPCEGMELSAVTGFANGPLQGECVETK